MREYMFEIMGIGFLLVIVGLLVYLPAHPQVNVYPKESTNLDLITASATYSTHVKPDVAYVTLTIDTNAGTAAESQTRNAAVFDKLKQSLINLGFNVKDLQTIYYHIYKDTVYDNKTKRYVFLGYKTDHVLRLKISNLSAVGKALDAAIAAGVTSVGDVQYTLSDKTKRDIYLEVLREATKLAKQKAEIMAEASGYSLGKLHSLEIMQGYYPIYRGYIPESASQGNMASTELEPKNVTVSVTVSAKYIVE